MNEDLVSKILKEIDHLGFNPETMHDLRRAHPKLRFSVVNNEDMEDFEPFATREQYQVFLLSSDGHCLGVTRRLDSAVGLILAEL